MDKYMTRAMTTVYWILSTWIIPKMDYREQIYYSAPHIIDDAINKENIKVNDELIKGVYHTVYEGDTICYNDIEHCFHKNDLVCAWLGGKL